MANEKREHAQDMLGDLKKIRFLIADSSSAKETAEILWAKPVDVNIYKLKNIPFYVHGVNYGDEVRTEVREGIPTFTDVIRRSGHSTYRVFLIENCDDVCFEKYWRPLDTLGCRYERATKRLFAIDVPPESDVHAAFRYLEVGETAGIWSFEEGHCGHKA